LTSFGLKSLAYQSSSSEPGSAVTNRSIPYPETRDEHHEQVSRKGNLVIDCKLTNTAAMCYYNQKKFSCGDWAWGGFASQCNHEYRVGETCGMRLINNTETIQGLCKLCDKIETKCRRRKAEEERLARWRREGGSYPASMERSQNLIKDLEQEIRQLEQDRQLKRISFGGR
jgi:hypothetical protein